MTRRPSVTAILKSLAAAGLPARATLPDGTVLEVLTNAATPDPHAADEAAAIEADERELGQVIHGAFAKKLR